MNKNLTVLIQTLKNTPKIISNYIDGLPKGTKVMLTSCCWGEWGQPEPKAILYSLKSAKEREIQISECVEEAKCDCKKDSRNIIYIFNPNDYLKINKFRKCYPDNDVVTYEEKGQKVFSVLYIK